MPENNPGLSDPLPPPPNTTQNEDALCRARATKCPRYPTGRKRGGQIDNINALKHARASAAGIGLRSLYAGMRRRAIVGRELLKRLEAEEALARRQAGEEC